MIDNSYFDRIFNRTSCIIEGKKKKAILDGNSKIKSLKIQPEQI